MRMIFKHIFLCVFFISATFPLHAQKKQQQEPYNPEFTHNLIEANRQKILGNFDAVKSLYDKCLKINPESAIVYYELSSYYVQQNQLKQAIEDAQKAAKLQPDNVWYQALLGVLYKQTKQFPKAIHVYQNLTKANPGRVDFWYELAYLYLYVNKPNKSLKIFNTIEKNTGIDENICLEKEKIYSEKGQYDKANNEIQKLINYNPSEIRYYGMLAESYLAQNRIEDADILYKKMLSIDSLNGLVHLSLADYYRIKQDLKQSFYHLEKAFRSYDIDADTKIKMLISLSSYAEKDQELLSEVDDLLKILLETHPEDSKVLTLQADFLLRANKITEAQSELIKITHLDPGKYIIWEELLMIDNNLKEWDSLLTQSDKALELFPAQITLYYFKAIAAFQLEKYAVANEALTTAQTMPIPNKDLETEIYALHGEVLHKLGKNKESDGALEKALDNDKSNKIVLNNYSYYLSTRSDSLDKAERMSLLCIELEPNNPTYLDTYAWVLYKENKLDTALSYIEKAYLLQHKNATIMEHYGDILYKLGQTDKAIQIWEEAFQAGKGSPFLEQKIQQKKLIER
jgi:tetratricopeptide (TPR) repeat protein